MNKFDPDWTVSPGAIILDLLEIREMSLDQLANKMNIDLKELSFIIDNKRSIRKIIPSLSKAIGIEEQFWINLQNRFEDDVRRGKTVDF